jgi:DNA-binding NarL/FixJ family response regulator
VLSDVRLYREGLVSILAHRADISAIGSGPVDADTLSRVVELAPDALILDFAAGNSLGFAQVVNARSHAVRVVAFAVRDLEKDVLACAEAGIAAFIGPDSSVDDIVEAVKRALRNELYCSAQIAGALFRRVGVLARRCSLSESLPLTRREEEIARLIEQGLSNKEIARSLRIGGATVKNHVHNLLNKLSVRRRGEAAAQLRAVWQEQAGRNALVRRSREAQLSDLG